MSLSLKIVRNAQRGLLIVPISQNACPFTISQRKNSTDGKEVCIEDPRPTCAPQFLKKTKCAIAKEALKDKTTVSPFKHLIEKPECCIDPCPDVYPRFDDLYYKASDKRKRKYTQTWVECPEKRIVKKPVCDFTKLIYPVLERRPRKPRAKVIESTVKIGDLGLMKCRERPKVVCPRFILPGCKGVRNPPKCKQERKPSNCKKICTPYPAFSECQKDPPKPKRKVECGCLDLVPMCDVFAEMRRLGLLN